MDYSNRVRIDLHIHTTASDGTLTPPEILTLACKLQIGAIAITDHDTMDGVREALCFGVPPSVQFLVCIIRCVTPPKARTKLTASTTTVLNKSLLEYMVIGSSFSKEVYGTA